MDLFPTYIVDEISEIEHEVLRYNPVLETFIKYDEGDNSQFNPIKPIGVAIIPLSTETLTVDNGETITFWTWLALEKFAEFFPGVFWSDNYHIKINEEYTDAQFGYKEVNKGKTINMNVTINSETDIAWGI